MEPLSQPFAVSMLPPSVTHLPAIQQGPSAHPSDQRPPQTRWPSSTNTPYLATLNASVEGAAELVLPSCAGGTPSLPLCGRRKMPLLFSLVNPSQSPTMQARQRGSREVLNRRQCWRPLGGGDPAERRMHNRAIHAFSSPSCFTTGVQAGAEGPEGGEEGARCLTPCSGALPSALQSARDLCSPYSRTRRLCAENGS